MSQQHIIRAWKDPEYRQSLNEAEQALLPPHPAGHIELTDADLDHVAGGRINLNNPPDHLDTSLSDPVTGSHLPPLPLGPLPGQRCLLDRCSRTPGGPS